MRSRSKTTELAPNPSKNKEEGYARPRSKTAPSPKTDHLIKAYQRGYFHQLLTDNPDTLQERHPVSQTVPYYQQWLQAYCKLVIVNAIEKAVHPMIQQARTEIVDKEKAAHPGQNVIKDIEEKVIEHILHNKKQFRQVVKDAIANTHQNPQQLLKNWDSNEPMDQVQRYLSEFSNKIKRKPWLKPNNADAFLNMLGQLKFIRQENELCCTRLEQSENIRHHGLFNPLVENQPTNSTPDNKTKPSALTKGSSLPSHPTSK